ncbi:equilibrative nucleoside transporter 4-like isoform X1 [Dinothrombium tinctorium]|uniref:Equilibrative nucleoside transporter 4-like isoform X1 n=1 Tax=Dinothrombium tinctorium TaxID=1965070 RepID=A0A3S3RPB5_9ACAR|nr:equilibrative nucleoside transporter 4-like isoform X1 [Dinothrombium tinctorium]RWS02755.1 equilibrative nucleoside transporter 4-like isoform X1 [Dinothrombium tinctorium]RWS02844.1 equilibrative nucleoside transporter 4-like isoform X1 [Dinothrombium tinctorium]
MDENLSRGYVLLLNNKWKYSPRFHYKRRRKKQGNSSGKSGSKYQTNDNQCEEDEEYLQSSPSLQQSSMGNSSSSSGATANFNFQTPPKDRCNLIYFGLLLAGVGFLLPYNSFVIAVDYFQSRYPGTTVVFDMSFIYILVAFCAVVINNILVEAISLFWRINIGYFLSFLTLLIVALVEIGWESFQTDVSYKLNLLAVAIVSFGCTVQQSSFYGYTSMLPSRYTQAVMTGESAAGLIVSFNRIVTKLLLDDEQVNTLLFFGISITIVACCIIIHNLLQRTTFVKFYINICSESTTTLTSVVESDKRSGNKSNTYSSIFQDKCQQNEDLNLVVDISDGNNKDTNIEFGILSFTNPRESGIEFYSKSETVNNRLVTHSESTEFDMPFGIDDEELQNYSPPVLPEPPRHGMRHSTTISSIASKSKSLMHTQRMERSDSLELVINNSEDNQHSKEKKQKSRSKLCNSFAQKFKQNAYFSLYQRFRLGLIARWEVSKTIWPFMLAISTAYFVTLSLFPGIESEIISCKLRSWMPVLLMAVFNVTDFLGKVIASFYYDLSAYQLMSFSCIRVLLIPLLTLCATPRMNPFFKNECWSIIFSAMLGLSNGIVGSLPMILAPTHVADDLKEMTGNIMTLSYSIGLTTGSALAYLIDWALGEPIIFEEICIENRLNNLTHV